MSEFVSPEKKPQKAIKQKLFLSQICTTVSMYVVGYMKQDHQGNALLPLSSIQKKSDIEAAFDVCTKISILILSFNIQENEQLIFISITKAFTSNRSNKKNMLKMSN